MMNSTPGIDQAVAQRAPVIHGQHHAEVGYRYTVPVHGIVDGLLRAAVGIEVNDQLMPVKIEVHPLIGAAALGAVQHLTVKAAGRRDIVHGNRQVKRPDFVTHCSSSPGSPVRKSSDTELMQ